MTELNPQESEFVRMTQQLFAFLTARGLSKVEVENDIEGVQVRFRDATTAVEIRLESERRLFVEVVPLRRGQLPKRFDERGRELLTHFPLTRLMAHIDPRWRAPEQLDDIATRDELLEVLGRLAEALDQHGDRIFRGDRDVFAQVEARMRRDLAVIMLENWARFVDRVRSGFDGNIAEYTSAITERGQLESILQTWRGNPDEDPRAQLARLDGIFDDLTEPVPAMKPPRDLFALVPEPNAARWWRRPKLMTGALREYFEARV
jgi:hypothetical protein